MNNVKNLLLEPQWRFENKLPATLESDQGETVELECTVEDPDAECEWHFGGEVRSVDCLNLDFSKKNISIRIHFFSSLVENVHLEN